jgi:hypothetical protein
MMSKAITESLITHESTRGFEKLSRGGPNLTDFVVIRRNPLRCVVAAETAEKRFRLR